MTATPAARLREAAGVVREMAAAALGNGEPWRYAKGIPDDSVRTATGWEVATSDDPKNLRYIALMNPVVGEALATWLESAADHARDGFLCCDNGAHQCSITAPALALADTVLAAVTR